MTPPLAKSRSASYLGARAAQTGDDGTGGYGSRSARIGPSSATATPIAWVNPDHRGRSMPLLPRPAARISLCMDFPGYLRALQQHDSAAASPLGPYPRGRGLRLSAVDPTSGGSDPRVGRPDYSALLPGLSLGSMTGTQKDEQSDGGGGGGGDYGRSTGLPSVRASVDAAASAELLPTLELSYCPTTSSTRFVQQPPPPPPPVEARWVTHGSAAAAESLGQLPLSGPAGVQQVPPPPPPAAPPPRSPPPSPPESAVSQSQVPLQAEWTFDADLQRARMQARYAAMDALDEILYEPPGEDDRCTRSTHSSSGSGGASRCDKEEAAAARAGSRASR
ncbi:hypothetical protein PLESTF_001468800 [Pleodorina starrii]|nr:hypothetical protein PLESTF_001468800 [Pleodorina starrii]